MSKHVILGPDSMSFCKVELRQVHLIACDRLCMKRVYFEKFLVVYDACSSSFVFIHRNVMSEFVPFDVAYVGYLRRLAQSFELVFLLLLINVNLGRLLSKN